MANFSAVIIANNEELHIRDCISSLLKVTNDIVLVDSGSTDKTVEIAKELGARVFNYEFKGYGANKNFGNKQAKYDWIISLDGDEVLSSKLIDEINYLIPKSKHVYALNSLVNYGGSWIKHSGWYPKYKNRIFNRKESSWNDAMVHEDLTPLHDKTIVKLSGDILHYSYESYLEHRKKAIQYGKLKALEWDRVGQIPGPFKKWGSPLFAFLKSYLIQKGFLDGKAGLHIAKMNYLQYRTAIQQFNNR
jgi:glycosyltransferase involved in cell wall biosynthesis